MSLQLEDFLSSEIITIVCSFRKNISWKKQFHSECGPCDIRNPKSSGQQIRGGQGESKTKYCIRAAMGVSWWTSKLCYQNRSWCVTQNEYPKMRRHSDLKSTITIQLYASAFLHEKKKLLYSSITKVWNTQGLSYIQAEWHKLLSSSFYNFEN